MQATELADEILTDVTLLARRAGAMALEEQQAVHFSDRAYKADGSVVTEADRRIESYLVEGIADLSVAVNIVSEESTHRFEADREVTLAVDPIDGTDVFSQGMPGWCVSVGILDNNLEPVAGVIYSPRLDLLIVGHVGQGASVNGVPLPPPIDRRQISERSNLMVTSRIHKSLDLSGYRGKIRSVGSAALHLCFHLVYRGVIGALEGPGIRIWDLAAAHAINRAQGEDLRYLDGDPIAYGTMVKGERGRDVVVAGPDPIYRALRQAVRRLDPEWRSTAGGRPG